MSFDYLENVKTDRVTDKDPSGLIMPIHNNNRRTVSTSLTPCLFTEFHSVGSLKVTRSSTKIGNTIQRKGKTSSTSRSIHRKHRVFEPTYDLHISTYCIGN